MAGGVKGRANRLFQGFFEGLIRRLNGRSGILEAMQLAGLMGDTRPDMSHREEHGFLIITDDTANAIAECLDRLQHPLRQGGVISGKQRGDAQDQAERQFADDIQGRVALLRLERINRQKETTPPEVGRMFGQTQRIGATQQHQKDADQIQHFTLRDRDMTFVGEHFMDLRHRPAFPEPPVADLDDDVEAKTTATQGQLPSRPRQMDSIPFYTVWIRATVSQIDDPVTTV